MCVGPVGNNQAYWGLIKITGQMTAEELDAFKQKLIDFLNDGDKTGLPTLVSARLANGTIKTDAVDGTSIALHSAR
jgi:hypothetical protein